jgi:hypothetical protein
MRTAAARRRAQVLAAITSSVVASATLAASAPAADTCANAAVRAQQSSQALLRCRGYELVTPDLNHSSLSSQPNGLASVDGGTFAFQTIDAPDSANSASPTNFVRADRNSSTGWHGASFSPAITAPTTAFNSAMTKAVSPDLTTAFEMSDQPLAGGGEPAGSNSFLGSPTSGYTVLTTAGTPIIPFANIYQSPNFQWGTDDFSHVFFQPPVAQDPSDPAPGSSTYEWSKQGGLQLLADSTIAPTGAGLAVPEPDTGVQLYLLRAGSADASAITFWANGRLYLRKDGNTPVTIDGSQRTVNPDPNPLATPHTIGVTADGKKAFFLSKSELTNDANTGESGGVATDAGNDLYSYDTTTGVLTDLTVGTDPADAATGANVRNVAGITEDGSYIYFTATGKLAPGATSGQESLYVWHDGQIEFLAPADGLVRNPFTQFPPAQPIFAISPDGQHYVFVSTSSLTGYDNTDPSTGNPHSEVFKGTLGKGIVCASCRLDGSRPTGDSTLSLYTGLPPAHRLRIVSDDGSSVFFNSTDVVIPQATSGKSQVFEYTDGKIGPISKPDGEHPSQFLDASASGSDAFFVTYDELVSNRNGGDMAVYDARSDGGWVIPADTRCRATACQAPATPAPDLPRAASLVFLGEDAADPADEGDVTSTSTGKVTVSKTKTVKGSAATLKVKVPGKGKVKVSGSSVKTASASASSAKTLNVRVSLTAKAVKSLNRHRTYKTRVKVTFVPSSGKSTSTTLSLTFTRKGA